MSVTLKRLLQSPIFKTRNLDKYTGTGIIYCPSGYSELNVIKDYREKSQVKAIIYLGGNKKLL